MDPIEFGISETHRNGAVYFALSGELDILSVPRLSECLAGVPDHFETVVLDLSQLTFIDSSGLAALIKADREARSDGWRLQIAGPLSPTVARLFELTAMDRVFDFAS